MEISHTKHIHLSPSNLHVKKYKGANAPFSRLDLFQFLGWN